MIERVLIVGGGIGGLCAAIGLNRVGISTEIVEKNRDWTVYGVGIIQPSNQLRALEELGLAQQCVELGAPFDGWEFFDQDGSSRGRVANPRVAETNYPPINGMARPALHKVLTTEALSLGVRSRLGITVDKIDSRSDAAYVTFSDGSADRYDLVLGADGTYSRVRSLIFEDVAAPTFIGLSVWRYNFQRPPGMNWGSVHYGHAAKIGLVPMAKDMMYMFVVTAEPGNPRITKDQLPDAMRERLTGFAGTIADLKTQITDPDGVVYRPMEPLLVPPPWHRGRVLLIGDAAHSTTPQLSQGASMAVEDAALLSQLLPQPRPLEEILQEFMRRRYERCKFVVDASLQLGRWELAEFEGRKDPKADHVGLMSKAAEILAQPY